jgi:ABC-type nitrate/sulfonate/bicarbonate transport system permease component
MMTRNLNTITMGLAPIVLVIALWQALCSFGYAPPSLLPPPGKVFLRLAQQLVSVHFLDDIRATLLRLFAGFFIAVVLGVSLPVIYHSFQGAKAVEEKMLWSGAAMGLTGAQRMLRIVLPAALPEILTGCRTGLVLALITMVTSEMIARQSGAGNILFNAMDMAQYDTVFAMIIIIGALGIGLDAAFDKLRWRLVAWAEPRQEILLSAA